MEASSLRLAWLDPDDDAGLREWDEFQMRSPRGHYSQLSTWLGSYRPYGLRFSVLVARREPGGPLVGGVGVLRAGRGAFALMRALGPILEVGAEDGASTILEALLEEAQRSGAFLLQLQFPCSTETRMESLLPSIELPNHVPHYPGRRVPAAGVPNQMLWIGFGEGGDRQDLLATLGPGARRHLRRAERQELEAQEVRQEEQIREAYALIEDNGRLRGYSTRTWPDFGPFLVRQVARGHAVMLVARHRGRPVAAHYAVLAGRRSSFIMGGTRRDHPHLDAGHFLHWAAIERARERGLLGYDFTSGGPPGVMQFKMGFRPRVISFVSPQYYVLSRWRCAAFFRLAPWLREHKAAVGRVLSATTRLLHAR